MFEVYTLLRECGVRIEKFSMAYTSVVACHKVQYSTLDGQGVGYPQLQSKFSVQSQYSVIRAI